MVDADAFIAQWGLDETARTVLTSMAPEAQLRVIVDFMPKGHTKNIHGLFYGFCKSVVGPETLDQLKAEAKGGGKGEQVQGMESFDQGEIREKCDAWCSAKGLEAVCVDTLIGLTNEIRERVLGGFSAKENTKNPTGLFMSYVKSMAAGPKGSSKGKSAPYSGPNGGYAKGGQDPMYAQDAAPMSEGEVAQFVQTWELDEECAGRLAQSPASVQREIVNTFVPKDGTRNVKSLFMGFMKSVSKSHGFSGWVGGPEPQHHAWGMSKPAYDSYMGWGQQPLVSKHEVIQFGEAWGLDQECGAILASQPPEVQRATLDRFRAKEGTRDVKGLFMSFIKSLSRGGIAPGAAKGGGKAGGKDYASQAYAGKDYGGKGKDYGGKDYGGKDYGGKGYGGKGKDSGYGGGKGGWKGSDYYEPVSMKRPAPAYHGGGDSGISGPPPSDQDIQQFSTTWGLDESCIAALAEQPGDVQRKVLDRFQPKVDTKDIASLFKGFLKSFVFGPSKRPRF